MAGLADVRKLARELAEAAEGMCQTHGPVVAQTAVYGALLEKWRLDGAFKCVKHSGLMLDIPQQALVRDVWEYYRNLGMHASVYFYEEFLRVFDNDYSGRRGVRYSPPEVVSYMVRGAAALLGKHEVSLDDALLLDPCCGIGTFPHFIENHTDFRPQMIGLELSPATSQLARYLLDRCEVIQADSLEELDLPLNERPLVVMGNPPYSGHSANSGKTSDLLRDYRVGLRERNPKWLQDDYVKFIRMAQHRVDQAGRGLVAFITNHSFIFNPTFRAMRESLMQSFDDIYILDLHGNAKKVETVDGEPDENVFPIQMGVAISFMLKWQGEPGCRIHHAELRGKREDKLKALAEMAFDETPWAPIQPITPQFSFALRNAGLQEEFYGFPSITELFRASSVGFVTSRDSFAVDSDRDALVERIAALRDGTIPDDVLRKEMGAGDLDIERARRELQADQHWREKVAPVLYRPFDRRWAYYSRAIMERPRLPFMENLMRDNLALAVGRAGHATGSSEWDVVFCTDLPTDLNLFRRGGALLLPRWVHTDGEKQSNIKAETDHDRLFAYIYALLHSTAYRQRYADLLSLDFPRIPLPQDADLIERLADLGSELMDIHLQRRLITSDAIGAEMTVGGYKLPPKQRDGLDECRLGEIAGAISETINVRNQIDEIISAEPPWRLV